MIEPIPWMQREFDFSLPLRAFPAILERLRGTPARAAELVEGIAEIVLNKRSEGKWSAKEHLGHLADLEALDRKRLDEFLAHVTVLSAADMRNESTENARHRSTPMSEILFRMRLGREAMVHRLERLTEREVAFTALHPRLQRQMRLLDWAWFVAEHDDYHLAQARRAIQKQLTDDEQ